MINLFRITGANFYSSGLSFVQCTQTEAWSLHLSAEPRFAVVGIQFIANTIAE